MRTFAVLAALTLLPAPLLAVEVTFSGAKPEALGDRTLTVDAAVVPWEDPVVVEIKDATTAVVRPAKDDEDPTPAKPFYRFEWTNKDKSSAKLFPKTPQEKVDQLRKQNDALVATSAGQALENSIIQAYTNKYQVISKCMANDKELPDAITMYVTLVPGQPQATAVIMPESTVAECVQNATDRGQYPAVKEPSTARFRVALSR